MSSVDLSHPDALATINLNAAPNTSLNAPETNVATGLKNLTTAAPALPIFPKELAAIVPIWRTVFPSF